MSLVVEFALPADALALEATLSRLPDASVEIEQNVWHASTEMEPYVWVSGTSTDRFDAAVDRDPSVESATLVEQFEDAGLYRLRLDPIDTEFLEVLRSVPTALQGASTAGTVWELSVRFDDRAALSAFQSRCCERDVSYEVLRLADLTDPPDVGGYQGLTPKQHEALSTAYAMGYFRQPRDVTLEEIATHLDISRQALSRRLRRGQQQVFASAFSEDSSISLQS